MDSWFGVNAIEMEKQREDSRVVSRIRVRNSSTDDHYPFGRADLNQHTDEALRSWNQTCLTMRRYSVPMGSITFISGAPACGKSTLARSLAAQRTHGALLPTDDFYRFLSHPINPALAESRMQNQAVVRAFTASAATLAADGYDVLVEGVIGPWWLEHIAAICTEIAPTAARRYVLLTARLDVVLARARARGVRTQISATPEIVAAMHAQFDAIEGFASVSVDTNHDSPSQLVAIVEQGLADGRFDWATLPMRDGYPGQVN